MNAKDLEKQFNFRNLLHELKTLKDKNYHLTLNYNNLINKQDNIIDKKVRDKTKEITQKHKVEIKDIEEKFRNEISEKDNQIEVLKREVARLTSRLDNDASNSGIPTSKTAIGKKKYIPNSREKTNLKVGGQKGHKKSKLNKFKDEEITEIVEVTPEECPNCKSSDITLLGTNKTKDETDYDVKVIKRRYQFNDCKCNGCNNSFRSKIPKELKEDNQYGTTVQSLAVSLTNEIYTPFNKTVKLISGITNDEINLSEGFVVKLQKRASGNLDKFIGDCKFNLTQADVYGWDDAGITVNQKQAYLRIYATEKISYLVAHERKNKESLDKDGILINTSEKTTVMHDHLLHNYNSKYRFKNVECLIHLIRRLKKSHEETKHKWQLDLKELLSNANKERNSLLEKNIERFDKTYLDNFKKKYDKISRRSFR